MKYSQNEETRKKRTFPPPSIALPLVQVLDEAAICKSQSPALQHRNWFGGWGLQVAVPKGFFPHGYEEWG